MASLSEKLRRERELRGISLKQIADDTKIGVRFLEALEENRLELIPGEFYRRSYLRAYARYLGLDEDRALNAYSYSRGEARTVEDEPAEASGEESESSSWTKWAVAAVVVLFAAGIVLLRSMPSATEEGGASPEASLETTPAAESAAAAPEATASAPPEEVEPATPSPRVPPAAVVTTPSDLSQAPPPDHAPVDTSAPLRLVLAVEETCWLEIEADGVVVATGLKEEGFRQALSAESEVRLWLGNAGGVALWVNERRAKPLGGDGQVRKDLTITPGNFRDFVGEGEDLS